MIGPDVKVRTKDDQEIVSNLLWKRIKGRGEVEGTHSRTERSGTQNQDRSKKGLQLVTDL